VETIHALICNHGYASVTGIAKTLKVQPSSVTEMLKKLSALGFVEYKPYHNVTLTKKGEELAGFLKQTKLSLQNFLKLLDVTEHVAEEDACKIEHILHESTLQALSAFVDFIQNTAQGDAWISGFKKYRVNKNTYLLN